MIWKRIFGRSDRDEVPFALYRALVAQARLPGLYIHAGVPDTLEGRFEMVMLHAFLVLRRLKATGETGRGLAQRIFDIMFDDMDQSLREIGVGDLSVGKKIKKMAQAFYGRVAAYDAGLDSVDDATLEEALRRNVFAEMEVATGQVAMLAGYMRKSVAVLSGLSDGDLFEGRIAFAEEPHAPAILAEGPIA